MHECLEGIFNYILFKDNQTTSNDLIAQIKTTRIQTIERNPKINELLDICTTYASKLIVKQLKSSELCKYSIIDSTQSTISLTSNNSTYHVQNLRSCTCSIFTTFSIPCKHIFFCRRLKNVDIFDLSLIENRWKKVEFQNKVTINDLNSSNIYK